MADEPTTQEPVAVVEAPLAAVTAPPVAEEALITPPVPVVETPPTPQQAEEARRTRFQRRIDELTREKHDAQREVDRLRAQVDGRATVSRITTTSQEPRAEDFGTTEEYVKAVAKFEVQQERQEAATQDHLRRVADEHQAAITRFEPQMEKARTKYADFDEVTSAPLYGPQTQQLLYASPQGAEIAYFLGAHPQEADKLNRMPIAEAARAIVKLEQRFEAPPPKTISSAPPPITPVTGTAAPAKDPEQMNTAEWMAWDKQQRLEKLKIKPI